MQKGTEKKIGHFRGNVLLVNIKYISFQSFFYAFIYIFYKWRSILLYNLFYLLYGTSRSPPISRVTLSLVYSEEGVCLMSTPELGQCLHHLSLTLASHCGLLLAWLKAHLYPFQGHMNSGLGEQLLYWSFGEQHRGFYCSRHSRCLKSGPLEPCPKRPSSPLPDPFLSGPCRLVQRCFSPNPLYLSSLPKPPVCFLLWRVLLVLFLPCIWGWCWGLSFHHEMAHQEFCWIKTLLVWGKIPPLP